MIAVDTSIIAATLVEVRIVTLLFKGNNFSHADVQICRWQ